VHTTFLQTLTATGRLSSIEPNLQNIPIREEEGRRLRNLFISAPNHSLVTADYSQIELRLLAHFSNDHALKQAFFNGEDVHTETASKVFRVAYECVTSEMRGQAKAVNFGIIYGISDFGLAQQLKIPQYKAKALIETYFERFDGVKNYLNASIATAKEKGYASTVLGRLRIINELSSSNVALRKFGQRVAMNMPLQGGSADIIKTAMLRVDKALKQQNKKAKLILQVHDELILECPKNEIEQVAALVKYEMENAAKLKVPLIADVSYGGSWYDAE
jgi:DNA polymerase-1